MSAIHIDTIREVLEACNSGELSRELGVTRSLIRRYQTGESSVENMTLGLALKFMEYAKKMEMDKMNSYDYSISTIEYWENKDYDEQWEREVFLTESQDTTFEAANDEEALKYIQKYVARNLGMIKSEYNPRLKNAIVYVAKAVEFNEYDEPTEYEDISVIRLGFDEE